MKNFALTLLLASIALLFSCEKNTTDAMSDGDSPVYLQDNIFGCGQFETMETSASFAVNVEPCLEVFGSFFVYEDLHGLVIKDGFNGPTLQTHNFEVQDLVLYNNQLMVCAEEGVYRLDDTGHLNTVTEERCFSMTLDGKNRLLLQGVFGTPNYASSYNIFEFKNNTLVPFAGIPGFFECISVVLEGGADEHLYAISCDNEIASYEDGVLLTQLDNGEAPLFATNGELLLHQAYDGGLIAITHDLFNAFRMYKLRGQDWLPIYDLAYEDRGTEKNTEVFTYVDNNILIYNDYLYTFNTGGVQSRQGIARFALSGDQQQSWEDIDLIEIPGLQSRDIVDVIIASDGHAYAVLKSNSIVKIMCG
jgi:hypothetical protein